MESEKEFTQEIKALEKKVSGTVINSKESFEFVQQGIIAAKNKKVAIVAYFKTMKDPAYASWKAICNRESEMLKPLDDFIKRKTKETSDYLTEQDRIRREEQRKADEDRQKKEQAERDKLNRAADRAELKGNEAKAEALREKADQVFEAPVIVQGAVDKTTRLATGTISQKKDVEIIVKDEKALLAAIMAGKAPMSIIEIKMGALKNFINANQFKEFPGCEIRPKIAPQIRIAKGM